MRVKAVAVLAVLMLFCVLAPLEAQEARGTLPGRVTDPSKTMVGLKIDALNSDTGVHFASTTNRSGGFRLFAYRRARVGPFLGRWSRSVWGKLLPWGADRPDETAGRFHCKVVALSQP